jgi:hypothetical protein
VAVGRLGQGRELHRRNDGVEELGENVGDHVQRLVLVASRERCPWNCPTHEERPLVGREREQFDRATATPSPQRGGFLLRRPRELVRRRRIELQHGSVAGTRAAGENMSDETARQLLADRQVPALGADGNRRRQPLDPCVVSG